MARLLAARDPFWDMDGHGVRRGSAAASGSSALVALTVAIAAVGLTVAAWLRELAPFLG